MNKTELIEAVAKDAGLSKRQAGEALNSTLGTIQKTLKSGKKVTLPGFGTFLTSKRAARIGRNPQTGASIKISARRVARFKAGKTLADAVR